MSDEAMEEAEKEAVDLINKRALFSIKMEIGAGTKYALMQNIEEIAAKHGVDKDELIKEAVARVWVNSFPIHRSLSENRIVAYGKSMQSGMLQFFFGDNKEHRTTYFCHTAYDEDNAQNDKHMEGYNQSQPLKDLFMKDFYNSIQIGIAIKSTGGSLKRLIKKVAKYANDNGYSPKACVNILTTKYTWLYFNLKPDDKIYSFEKEEIFDETLKKHCEKILDELRMND